MSRSAMLFLIVASLVVLGCENDNPWSAAVVSSDAPPEVSPSTPASPDASLQPHATAAPDCPSLRDGVDFKFLPVIARPHGEPVVSISCAEVVDYALSDWAGAHDKWSGQVLEVRGLVGGTTCTLDGLECMQLVRAQTDSNIPLECIVERGTWLKCHEGQTVRVRGYWDSLAMSPRLVSVQIVEVTGESAAIEMDVQAFREIITKDFEEARERFRKRRIILHGAITSIEPQVPEAPPFNGVTSENAPFGEIVIGGPENPVVRLDASDRPGRNVFAHRRLRVGDLIIASFPITDLAENHVGADGIEVLNSFVALQEDIQSNELSIADGLVAKSAATTIHRMTSAEFAAMCEQHLREMKTLIDTDEYEITGRLHRYDPFLSINAVLDDGPDHRFGVKPGVKRPDGVFLQMSDGNSGAIDTEQLGSKCLNVLFRYPGRAEVRIDVPGEDVWWLNVRQSGDIAEVRHPGCFGDLEFFADI